MPATKGADAEVPSSSLSSPSYTIWTLCPSAEMSVTSY